MLCNLSIIYRIQSHFSTWKSDYLVVTRNLIRVFNGVVSSLLRTVLHSVIYWIFATQTDITAGVFLSLLSEQCCKAAYLKQTVRCKIQAITGVCRTMGESFFVSTSVFREYRILLSSTSRRRRFIVHSKASATLHLIIGFCLRCDPRLCLHWLLSKEDPPKRHLYSYHIYVNTKINSYTPCCSFASIVRKSIGWETTITKDNDKGWPSLYRESCRKASISSKRELPSGPNTGSRSNYTQPFSLSSPPARLVHLHRRRHEGSVYSVASLQRCDWMKSPMAMFWIVSPINKYKLSSW